MKYWQTSRRRIQLNRPLVMGILNITPDSFSDGGKYASPDAALLRAEQMIAEGADIIDLGGESTRPGSHPISVEAETERTIPIIEALVSRFDTPISIDTYKSEVAKRAVDAGAEIINDISGLRFDANIANIASDSGSGLILMHSRGNFESMHSEPPVDEILPDVTAGFRRAVEIAENAGVSDNSIVLDIGIGFGKTLGQNLELLAKIDRLVGEFPEYPILVGTSRKSFIGRVLDERPPSERAAGSLASATAAMINGALVVRVHDVIQTVDAMRILMAIREASG